MARIDINDLPQNAELSREEQQEISGGWSWGETQQGDSFSLNYSERKAGEKSVDYLKIKLDDVIISS